MSAVAMSTAKKLPLVFVTGNQGKLREVQALLGQHVPSLTNIKLDLPELQGEPEDICAEKCRLAVKEVQGPVIVEDTSLCFNALNGLPGVYIKWFLEKTGHEGLNNMLAAYPDKSAYSQCVFAFCQSPSHEPVLFTGRCPGTIVPAAGPTNFGWDPVFKPDGHDQTFAQMDKEVKNSISHRSRALDKLRAFFEKNPEVLDALPTPTEEEPEAKKAKK